MFSSLRHPCDMPRMKKANAKCLMCGLCGTEYFDCIEKRCRLCTGTVHLGKQKWGITSGSIKMHYEFYRWRVGMKIINEDRDYGKSIIKWLQEMSTENLKTHEGMALDIEYMDWTHRRVAFLLFQIAKIFGSTRSKVATFTIMIELGELMKDLMKRLKGNNQLSPIASYFANTVSNLMNDTEKALNMNKMVEKFRTIRTLDDITE